MYVLLNIHGPSYQLDVGSALNDALLDNKITPEEAAKIKKEWLEAKAAFKSLIGK